VPRPIREPLPKEQFAFEILMRLLELERRESHCPGADVQPSAFVGADDDEAHHTGGVLCHAWRVPRSRNRRAEQVGAVVELEPHPPRMTTP
jgi:hypothetical protein